MQVFKCEINNPNGKINHNVHCEWDDQGNLHFCEHDLGEGVKEFWGTDEYEYFMMIPQKHVAKFILCSFWKGFTFEKRFTVKDLRDLCDEYEINFGATKYIRGKKAYFYSKIMPFFEKSLEKYNYLIDMNECLKKYNSY